MGSDAFVRGTNFSGVFWSAIQAVFLAEIFTHFKYGAVEKKLNGFEVLKNLSEVSEELL